MRFFAKSGFFYSLVRLLNPDCPLAVILARTEYPPVEKGGLGGVNVARI